MNTLDEALGSPQPARGDVAAERVCLRCRTPFPSEGFGERICKRCKGQSAWKSANPPGDGGSRRGAAR